MAKIRCPGFFCNSKDVIIIDKKKESYLVSKGVLGALLVDHELGILFGIEGAVHTYKCMKCGKKWKE